MELAKQGFVGSTADAEQIVLYPQDLIAYDIYVVRFLWVLTAAPADSIDEWLGALSKRQEDMLEEGVLELNITEIMASPAVFAMTPMATFVNTEGGAAAVLAHTITYPKPYTVPFAAAVFHAAGSVVQQMAIEVYYDEIKVSAREMVWLRRRTEVARTS